MTLRAKPETPGSIAALNQPANAHWQSLEFAWDKNERFLRGLLGGSVSLS